MRHGCKKMTLLMFLKGFWYSKWKYVILGSLTPTYLFSLYLNMTFKICSIDLNHLYMKRFGDEKWSNPWFRLGMLNEATPNSVLSSIQHDAQEQKCRWQRTQTPPVRANTGGGGSIGALCTGSHYPSHQWLSRQWTQRVHASSL
jgi:hypothetical protein